MMSARQEGQPKTREGPAGRDATGADADLLFRLEDGAHGSSHAPLSDTLLHYPLANYCTSSTAIATLWNFRNKTGAAHRLTTAPHRTAGLTLLNCLF
ncbi:hypothetical protein LSTR_LSTR006343 [Laodelphax striatellus]|uniref:Uncharacterized protein n=1 Tax=Laodelphax striatellus TaxID=195883 RepID=A0A482XDN3_LAOST|nr:hypothetical protein LSTR_LSTR006343 [Laodelphax striatellus]